MMLFIFAGQIRVGRQTKSRQCRSGEENRPRAPGSDVWDGLWGEMEKGKGKREYMGAEADEQTSK